MHIFKYLKIDANFSAQPNTPRKREEGKILINYLFGKPVIQSIDLNEAKKINDINNWKNIENLRSIFSSETNLSEEDKEKMKINKDYINLCFTGEELDDNEDSDIDINIDMDIN